MQPAKRKRTVSLSNTALRRNTDAQGLIREDRIRAGQTYHVHAPLTSFQEGPHAFHYTPEFISAFQHVLDMPVELVRACGVKRSAFYI